MDRSRYHPHSYAKFVMSLEAARKLSVLELLRVLDEKLDLEFTRVRETCLHRAPAAFLEAEVSTPRVIYLRGFNGGV